MKVLAAFFVHKYCQVKSVNLHIWSNRMTDFSVAAIPSDENWWQIKTKEGINEIDWWDKMSVPMSVAIVQHFLCIFFFVKRAYAENWQQHQRLFFSLYFRNQNFNLSFGWRPGFVHDWFRISKKFGFQKEIHQLISVMRKKIEKLMSIEAIFWFEEEKHFSSHFKKDTQKY